LSGILAEINDRYGAIPPELDALSKIMEIRILSRRLKVSQIDRNSQGVYFTLHPSHDISPVAIRRLSRDPKVRLIPEYSFQILLKKEAGSEDVLAQISRYLHALAEGAG
ncbi:MAG TPA: TRCF domain-containing protein, partial [Nitrospiria bacterium]|nr:TRCF domain-containing protein [Nitrospiria bacterium]